MSDKAKANHEKVIWAQKADDLAIVDYIAGIISQPGDHRIAVPGGRTPLPIFVILSQRSLPWERLSLMLTDDRIVPENHEASNHGKLVSAFNQTACEITALQQGPLLQPFDLVWLGMGADGHIASLFPEMEAQEASDPAVIKTVPDPLPVEAPFERLSLNMAALTNSKAIMLVVRGADKKHVLDAAIAGDNNLPITKLLNAAHCPITIYWSP